MLSVLCTAFTDTDKLEHTRGEGPRWVRDKSPGPETRIQECLECSLMSPELRPFHFGLLGQVLGSLISQLFVTYIDLRFCLNISSFAKLHIECGRMTDARMCKQ